MSGIYAHIARRGLEAYNASPVVSQDAREPDNEGPVATLELHQMLAIAFTVVVATLLFASVKYTLSEVVSSLVMIEQPKTLVVAEAEQIEDDKMDSDKAPLMDVELTIMKQEPVTSSIRKTMSLLSSVGGRRAQWRGLGVSCVYHLAHSIAVNALVHITMFMFGPMAKPFSYFIGTTIATVLLCRIHMTWTHVMISGPSQVSWFRRVPQGKKYLKALALPSLVFAVTQHLVVLIPFGVFMAWGPVPVQGTDVDAHVETLRILATLASGIFVAVALLLPASVTLTRIEASLLPEDQETIVNFDRTLNGAATFAITDEKVDTRALFDAAWRSFDRSSRLRLVKFYAKMGMTLASIAVLGVMAVTSVVMTVGLDNVVAFADASVSRAEHARFGGPN